MIAHRPAAMRLVVGLGLLLTWLSSAALAQQPPYDAVAKEAGVKLRSGSNHTYYLVGKLDKGQRVTVKEVYFGWFRIEPPEGVFSYVPQGHVNAQGDGSVGVVSKQGGVDVLAAHIKGRPDLSYAEQVKLDEGAKVQIVGEAGSYYKIVPPANADVFAPPQSLKPVAGGQNNQPAPAEDGSDADDASEPADAGDSAGESVGEGGDADEADGNDPSGSGDAAEAAEGAADADPAAGGGTTDGGGGDTSTGDATSNNARDDQTAADAGSNGSGGGEAGSASDGDGSAGGSEAEPSDASAGGAGNSSNSAGESASSGSGEQTTEGGSTGTASAASGGSDGGADSAAQPGGSGEANGGESGASPDMAGGKGAAAVQTKAESKALRQLERKMLPKFKLPLAEQPVETMIAKYRAMKDRDLSAYDRQIVSIRLDALRRNRELKQTLAKIQEVEDASDAAEAAAETQPAEQEPKVLPRARYDAVGRLLASSVYDGENLPRLFRLVEPSSGYTVGYVEPGEVNASRVLGREVGIMGTKGRDRSLNVWIFDIERLDVFPPAETSAGE